MQENITLVNWFGYILALGIVATSLAMIALGGRWQAIEASAYSGERRPWWFWVLSTLLIVFYLAALVVFLTGEKSIAGWILMVLIPVGWVIKGGLVIFNAKGRQTVSSVTGDANWVKIGLLRLPVALGLAVLAALV